MECGGKLRMEAAPLRVRYFQHNSTAMKRSQVSHTGGCKAPFFTSALFALHKPLRLGISKRSMRTLLVSRANTKDVILRNPTTVDAVTSYLETMRDVAQDVIVLVDNTCSAAEKMDAKEMKNMVAGLGASKVRILECNMPPQMQRENKSNRGSEEHAEGTFVVVQEEGRTVGRVQRLYGPEDVKVVEHLVDDSSLEYMVVEVMESWSVIPAENLIALFQKVKTKLMFVVNDVEEAKVMMDVLECGSDGIVIEGKDAIEVRRIMSFISSLEEAQNKVEFQVARVVDVRLVGTGDRACVDLCENMAPGEGMCVGSFARCLFLIHSECEETSYINARPFRVNAGPVHSYAQVPGKKTAYLSELRSGSEVEVFNTNTGKVRSVLVGRVKIERRPMILIEAEGVESGMRYSVILQNAETVKVIGPLLGDDEKNNLQDNKFQTISVAKIKPGDAVYVLEQCGDARHTGVLIEEYIREC